MWTMCEFHDSNCNGFGDYVVDRQMYLFSSIDVLQVVTHDVHLSSLGRLICPAQDHFDTIDWKPSGDRF